MKKRNRFLKIVSFVLGVFVICGFFACSIYDHNKKSTSVSATSNVQTLANSNFNISSNDLVHYDLTNVPIIYSNNINFNNGNYGSYIQNSGQVTWWFDYGQVYKFELTTYYEANVELFLVTDKFTNSTIQRLDNSQNPTTLKKNGSVYSCIFRVISNSSITINSGGEFIRINKNGLSNVPTCYSLKELKGTYRSDLNYINYELLNDYYNTYGVLESTKFDVDYYYNGVLYNGLMVSFSGTEGTYILNVTTADFSYRRSGVPFIYVNQNYLLSDLMFISGPDINNLDLIRLFNSFFTIVGYNNYDISTATIQFYEDTIASLNSQLQSLQEENNTLSNTIIELQHDNEFLYLNGYQDGVSSINSQLQEYYQNGYSDGYTEGFSADTTATTIFSGILTVAMVPVNFFLSIFNFEILGINLSAFIRAIFTVVLTIIVIKTVTGKGGGGSDN